MDLNVAIACKLCPNEARYLCADNTFRCGLCSMYVTSIRLTDLAALLRLSTRVITQNGRGRGVFDALADSLREIISIPRQ